MQKTLFACIVTLCLALPVAAEEIKIPVGAQGAEASQPGYLPRGSSQRQVEAAYGTPLRIKGPVGRPPITAWEYQGHVAYFEYDRLLHIVAKHVPYVD